jgi:hypothetical protein
LCAAAAIVLALGEGMLRTSSMATVAAVLALVTGVALAWFPLMVLAGPAVLTVWPTRRALWRGTRASSTYRRASFALLALMAVGVLRAGYLLVTTVSVSEVVVAQGQVGGAPFPVVLVLFLVTVGAVIRLCSSRDHLSGTDRRLWWLVLTPVGGFAALATILVLQMRSLGTSSYYFLKLLVGFEVVLAALAAVAVAMLVVSAVPVRRGAKLRVLAAAAMAVAMTNSLGSVSWSAAPMLHPRLHGTDSTGHALDLTAMADGILASASPSAGAGPNSVYVAIGRGRGFDGVLPATWRQALTGTFSHQAHDRIGALGGTFSDAKAATPYVRDLLEMDGAVTVLVAPAFVASLRSSLGVELGERVLALPSSTSR